MVRRQTQSRMEKYVDQDKNPVPGGTGNYTTSFQIDGGEVEAQVKRIMLSLAENATKECTFKLGLFQFQPSATDFNKDEAIVISGAIGNQCWHNETITMRVPKEWYVGLQLVNFGVAATDVTWSLQLNYKVLN